MAGLLRTQDSGVVGRALVISDGCVGGLLATAIATEETVRRENLRRVGAPLVWSAWAEEIPPAARDAAVRRQAEAMGAEVVESESPRRAASESVGAWWNSVLLRAGSIALSAGCRRVVWPVQFQGPGSDEPAPLGVIAEAASRAVLVSRLVSLEAERAGLPELAIETPFLDLSDAQIGELCCEMGLRLEDCWWWPDSVTPAANRARARWGAALAGVV